MRTTTKAFAVLSFLLSSAFAMADVQVRMLKTWDDRYPGSTVICDRYAELLEEASNGEITVRISGPETIPPVQQLEPTRNGLFQVLCTYPGFHTGSATLLTGLESIRPDARAVRESGGMDVVEKVYQALGVHVLSVPLAHGYWIFLNRDLSAGGDLKGLQVRALPPQHPYIESIGGTPVVLPPAEMFSALERGVVDGALFPAAGAAGYGFPEVTGYYLDVKATAPHVILANPSFWNSLSDNLKAVFEEQARVLEEEIPGTYDRLNRREHERMAEAGMEFLKLDEDVAARLADAVIQGSWSFAARRDEEAANQLREKVEEAGLLRD